MRYLYTTQPDEGCHEVEKGIYGRPVQTCDESKLRRAGWSYTIDALRGTNHVREEKEGRKEEVEVKPEDHEAAFGNHKIAEAFSSNDRELLAEVYEDVFGKKPHHKMKAETIRQNIEDSI